MIASTYYASLPVVGPSSGRFLFGDGPGMRRVPCEQEWERLRCALLDEGRAAVCALTSFRPASGARCDVCGAVYAEQFGECGGMPNGRVVRAL